MRPGPSTVGSGPGRWAKRPEAALGGRVVGRIVVGVDGSDNALEALRWAVAEAELRDATVEAVTSWHYPTVGVEFAPVADPETFEGAATQSLQEAVAKVCPDDASRQRVRAMVVQDTPVRALVDAAQGADLLVVGSRGRGGFTGLLLGSVSAQCVHHAPCPVVVVPHHSER